MNQDSFHPAAGTIDLPIDSAALGHAEETIETTPRTLRDRAEELRDKAGEFVNIGIELARERPYAAAAVVGGVAATAAAAVYGGTRLAARRADKLDEAGG